VGVVEVEIESEFEGCGVDGREWCSLVLKYILAAMDICIILLLCRHDVLRSGS